MNNHQLEARAAKALANRQAHHIEFLQGELDASKHAFKQAMEKIKSLERHKKDLEDFVKFANIYYPGSVQQYHAIKALEGEKV